MIRMRTVSLNQGEERVASIFDGAWTLVSVGVVKGRKLPFYWRNGVPEKHQEVGGRWRDQETVVDGS